MDKALRTKAEQYLTAMSVIKEMLKNGIVSYSDVPVLSTVLASKCGLSSCTIFSDIDLIISEKRGNIRY